MTGGHAACSEGGLEARHLCAHIGAVRDSAGFAFGPLARPDMGPFCRARSACSSEFASPSICGDLGSVGPRAHDAEVDKVFSEFVASHRRDVRRRGGPEGVLGGWAGDCILRSRVDETGGVGTDNGTDQVSQSSEWMRLDFFVEAWMPAWIWAWMEVGVDVDVVAPIVEELYGVQGCFEFVSD